MKYIDKGIIAFTTDVEKGGKNVYIWYYDPCIAVWSEIKQNKYSMEVHCGGKD